ncbi:hypothetical protein GGF42_005398 [Coemansia sp. RSA 2424]|nr:hypothetical protein GGF42_005398 [Coemansia sp. RSA 2424]
MDGERISTSLSPVGSPTSQPIDALTARSTHRTQPNHDHLVGTPAGTQALADSAAKPNHNPAQFIEHSTLLFHSTSGKLKTKAPNAFMLFRLSVIKSLKGTNRSANEINMNISGQWNNMSLQEKGRYKAGSCKIQRLLDVMNSRVPWRAWSAEQIQIVVSDLFHSSISTRVISSRVSEHSSDCVVVLWGSTLGLNSASIVSFQPDKSGNGILYPNQQHVSPASLQQ